MQIPVHHSLFFKTIENSTWLAGKNTFLTKFLQKTALRLGHVGVCQELAKDGRTGVRHCYKKSRWLNYPSITPPPQAISINQPQNTVCNFCKENVSASSLCSSWGLPWMRPPHRRSRPAAASQTLQYTNSHHTWHLCFIQHKIKAIGIFLGQREF